MENIIGYHCAPALAGIKPSNIVTCYKNKGYDVTKELIRLNGELNNRGIYLKTLCECEMRALVMVYRRNVLEKALNDGEVKKFLVSLGYPEKVSVDEYITCLKARFKQGAFPHEIGAFLGYPMHDIYGFMFHKDTGCLLSGEWKVYKNPEEAKKLFDRFTACRRAVSRRILSGHTLAQVFCAA